ncbi:MAG: Xaa-Pro peptidase family protein [Hyphomicrobiaceae bacterium]
MAQLGRHRRKIDPSTREAEGALGISYIGPANPAIPEWQAAGLAEPDFGIIRKYRLDRLRAELKKRDFMGCVLYDPLNIRYATDVSNMQVWCLHNFTRYCFVATEGPVVLFDYEQAVHLSKDFPLVSEARPSIGWFYMYAGSQEGERAGCKRWARDIVDLVKQHGGGNRRLAFDKCEPLAIDVLRAEGIEPLASQEFCEEARKIKHPEEIKAMRRSINTTEVGMAAMWRNLKPGITENQLWAKLHEANIARGGEWIETRLLASGPRTNPWFHECSDRVIEAGDIVSFDTDLVGPYGYCADISRAWVTPGKKPTNQQISMHQLAREHIAFNTDLVKPGMSFLEFTDKCFELPEDCKARRYGVVMHGVGLCDEYPSILYREDKAIAHDGVFEPGMVLCVESLICPVGGKEGVKLENQLLITETGVERLDNFSMELTPEV